MSFWVMTAVFLWNLLALVAVGLLWATRYPWVARFWRALRFQPRELPSFGLLDPWFLLGTYFLVMVGAALVSQSVRASLSDRPDLDEFAGEQRVQVAAQAVLFGGQLVLVAVWIAFAAWRSPRRAFLQWFGRWGGRRPWWQAVVLGLVVAAIAIPFLLRVHHLAGALSGLEYRHETLEVISRKPSAWLVALSSARAALVTPVVEELLYRGFLLGALFHLGTRRLIELQSGIQVGLLGAGEKSNPATRWQATPEGAEESGNGETADRFRDGSRESRVGRLPFWPVLVSSLVFGFNHVGQGAAPVAITLLAILLGELVRRTGSLWPAIVVHLTLNSYSVLLGLLVAG